MTTMRGFLRHFLRQEYGTFQLTDGGVDDSIYVWYRLADYVRSVFFEEGLFVVLPLACLGIFKPQVRYLIPLVCFAIHLGVLSYLANMDTNRALMRGVYVQIILLFLVHHTHEKHNYTGTVDSGNRRMYMYLLGVVMDSLVS